MMRKELMQDMFNRAVSGVYIQARPSIDSNGSCMYRGSSETKCAVGQLIDDKHYKSCLEGGVVFPDDEHYTAREKALQIQSAVEKSLGVGSLAELELRLLGDLQKLHDTMSGLCEESFRLEWLKGSNGLAVQYNLEPWTPSDA